ncbi:MAG: hypothetical protein V3R75_05560 [Alphaproteobacteria bacterium]
MSETLPATVLTLAAAIGEEVGFLGVLPLDRARLSVLRQAGVTFAQVSHSSERAHVMSVDFDCEVTGFLGDQPLLLHRCSSSRGDSGGPVLAMDTPRIVVIHDGHIEADLGRFGVAVPAGSFHDALGERLGPADGRTGGRLGGRRPGVR